MNRRITIAAVALLATIACGKSAEQKAAEQTAQAAQQAAQGAQGAAQGAQQAAQSLQQAVQGLQAGNANVKLVEFDVLKTLLPDISGWEKKNAKGDQMSMGVASFSHAEAHYENGTADIELDITDSAMSQLVLAPFVMFVASGYSEKSDDGYKKSIVVNGMPGFESWDKSAKRGEIVVIVGNRFIVQGTGHSVENVDPVKKIIESVDVAKLAGLK